MVWTAIKLVTVNTTREIPVLAQWSALKPMASESRGIVSPPPSEAPPHPTIMQHRNIGTGIGPIHKYLIAAILVVAVVLSGILAANAAATQATTNIRATATAYAMQKAAAYATAWTQVHATTTAQAVESATAQTQAQATTTVRARASAAVDQAKQFSSQWHSVYFDAFDTSTPNWCDQNYSGERADASLTINGEYNWNIKAKQGVSYWCLNNKTSLTDRFYLTAVGRSLSGPPSAAYGLIFRHSSDGYYAFEITGNKTFGVAMYIVKDDQWTKIIDRTANSSIDLEGFNRLTVIGQVRHYTFLINNTYVGEIDNDALQGGVAGLGVTLSAGETATFSFDNFELRTP
jgi:hypothetical protein